MLLTGTYTVADIAGRYATNETKVIGWIRSGELKAINIAQRTSSRAKWRITAEALESFERSRTSSFQQKTDSQRGRQESAH